MRYIAVIKLANTEIEAIRRVDSAQKRRGMWDAEDDNRVRRVLRRLVAAAEETD